MTNIKIFTDQDGSIVQYEISGHADFDEYGKDILCAAISVLSQTTLIALNKVCGIKEKDIAFSVDDESGYLKVSIPKNLEKNIKDKANVVLETMIVGIEDLAYQYPKYISIKKEEV
ncbi:hypothetical protein DUF464 [Gottschalkia acidurici 9a]|uniref:Ribosomal processing cysteine protease Prp n=1 Tax=Gottschalkia acidurici (strain ATCC 7906 / DSM 604 / BCRC 14475 / CIP 104303 / KCTC 5404 / NCIMB 10678 / 9a) TaxID=1128398 RepID=K0AYW7_GOTA9|nr:ribosomal-processing cysteine protease Prp [Gottschalkia acidurici]AFS78988.1 hypothetical protein DUF464 [Gottschalkia acidurici 9a]